MKKIQYLISAFLFSLLYLLVAFPALAQIFSQTGLSGAQGYDFRYQNLFNIVNKLACWFIRFGIILIGIMIVYYGIMFLMSRGSPQGVQNAKKALLWGMVGGLVIFGVFMIIYSFAAIIGTEYTLTLKC